MASKFDSAFAAARKAGKKNFSFGGKSYNTKLAKEPKGNGLPSKMKVPGVAGRPDAPAAKPAAASKSVSMAPPSAKSAKSPQSPLDVLKSGVRVGASAVSRGKTVDAATKANKPAAPKGGANFMQKLIGRKILGK